MAAVALIDFTQLRTDLLTAFTTNDIATVRRIRDKASTIITEVGYNYLSSIGEIKNTDIVNIIINSQDEHRNNVMHLAVARKNEALFSKIYPLAPELAGRYNDKHERPIDLGSDFFRLYKPLSATERYNIRRIARDRLKYLEKHPEIKRLSEDCPITNLPIFDLAAKCDRAALLLWLVPQYGELKTDPLTRRIILPGEVRDIFDQRDKSLDHIDHPENYCGTCKCTLL